MNCSMSIEHVNHRIRELHPAEDLKALRASAARPANERCGILKELDTAAVRQLGTPHRHISGTH
jgi:hypothetical protein